MPSYNIHELGVSVRLAGLERIRRGRTVCAWVACSTDERGAAPGALVRMLSGRVTETKGGTKKAGPKGDYPLGPSC